MTRTPANSWGRRDVLLWLAIGASMLSLVLHLNPFESGRPSRDEARPDVPPAAESSSASQTSLAELERRLEEESAKRQRIEQELAALTQQRAELVELDDPGSAADVAQSAAGGSEARPGLDESVLLEAGFSSSDARDLRIAFEKIQMEQLYLADQAAREGWAPSDARSDALAQLAQREEDLLQDYGDEAYDWLLYASGRPNQVSIRQIFGESPAASAGIRKGDVVVRYGDQRVRNGRDLKEATSAGEAGEWVDVELFRNGEIAVVRVPRGPLGVVLNVTSAPPASG